MKDYVKSALMTSFEGEMSYHTQQLVLGKATELQFFANIARVSHVYIAALTADEVKETIHQFKEGVITGTEMLCKITALGHNAYTLLTEQDIPVEEVKA